MVCRFEGRRREIRFVLHLLDFFFFFPMALYLQNYVTPLLTKMLLKQPVELTA